MQGIHSAIQHVDLGNCSGDLKLQNGAFKLSGLRKIILPKALHTAIPEECFEHCKHLNTIQIPDGVWKIGPRAFAKSGLREIRLPAMLTHLGHEAFGFTRHFAKVTVSSHINGDVISSDIGAGMVAKPFYGNCCPQNRVVIESTLSKVVLDMLPAPMVLIEGGGNSVHRSAIPTLLGNGMVKLVASFMFHDNWEEPQCPTEIAIVNVHFMLLRQLVNRIWEVPKTAPRRGTKRVRPHHNDG